MGRLLFLFGLVEAGKGFAIGNDFFRKMSRKTASIYVPCSPGEGDERFS